MSNPNDMPSLTQARIDLNALAHNCREIRRMTAPTAKIMAVVKADGYGHGAVEVSRVAIANGADYLAVARISEAMQLRRSGIDAPILLFGYAAPEYVAYLADNGIRASLDSLETARRLSAAACQAGIDLPIHIKIDTGMGRLGLLAGSSEASGDVKNEMTRTVQGVVEIARLPGLSVEGFYTHFANADAADTGHTRRQFALFLEILELLKAHGIEALLRHAANSAAIIGLPETHLDMVRPGISLYGLRPSVDVDLSRLNLRPVMHLASTVIQVKEVPAGFKISYGSTYETPAPTRIATIAIGYADGLSRLLSSKGAMLVRGVRAPIVGRVCMDLTMLDVGHVPGVRVGDEAVVFGRQGDNEISADEIAGLAGTINYEIVCALKSRVRRIYKACDA
jgi:alanine racemase